MIRSNDIVLTSVEAAEFLGLQADSIRMYVRRKLLVPASRVGRAFVFTKGECERFKKGKRPRGNPTFQKKTAAEVKPARRRKTKTAAKA